MTDSIKKITDKLTSTVEKTVDYITEHPIKSLLIAFVSIKIIKWLKD